MNANRFAPVLLCFASALVADDPSQRAQLIGSWQLEQGNAGPAVESWVLTRTGDAMHITHSESGDPPFKIECNTVGRECQLKSSGHDVKVSMWFNGPRLVQMEIKGSDVVKRRFAALDNGVTLEVETIPIVPPGKAEVRRYKRVPVTTASGTPSPQPH